MVRMIIFKIWVRVKVRFYLRVTFWLGLFKIGLVLGLGLGLGLRLGISLDMVSLVRFEVRPQVCYKCRVKVRLGWVKG